MSGAVVLLAGGSGSRLGAGRPKAFVEIGGRSLLSRVAETAATVGDPLVVVAPAGWEEEAERAAAGYRVAVRVLTGGAERPESVRRALEEVRDADRVVCHDVARPLATPELFRAVIGALADADAAVPVAPVIDTVKRVEDGMVVRTLPRDELAEAQTPQAFVRAALLRALAAGAASPRGVVPTSGDEVTLVRAAGFVVATVPSDPANVKVTYPADLDVAEAVLRARGGA